MTQFAKKLNEIDRSPIWNATALISLGFIAHAALVALAG